MSNKYIPLNFYCEIKELPSAIDYNNFLMNQNRTKRKYYASKNYLTLIYVGNLGPFYDLILLYEVITKLEFIRIIICCRKNEWEGKR